VNTVFGTISTMVRRTTNTVSTGFVVTIVNHVDVVDYQMKE
jgi:hypothetical protein